MIQWHKTWMLFMGAWLTTTAHAVAQEKFDLFCNIQEAESFHPDRITSFSRHVSVDLAALEWCIWDQGCDRLWRIARVTKDEIKLDDVDNSFMRLETSVNRKTWKWTNHAHIKEGINSGGETHGSCRLAPFTPFPPSAKRK